MGWGYLIKDKKAILKAQGSIRLGKAYNVKYGVSKGFGIAKKIQDKYLRQPNNNVYTTGQEVFTPEYKMKMLDASKAREANTTQAERTLWAAQIKRMQDDKSAIKAAIEAAKKKSFNEAIKKIKAAQAAQAKKQKEANAMRFKQSWWRQNRTVIKKKIPVSPPVQIQQVKTTAGTVAQVVQHTNNTQASSTQNNAGMVRLAVLGAALFLK